MISDLQGRSEPFSVTDGFGNHWQCARGLVSNCGLQIVRPGKVQCWCDNLDFPVPHTEITTPFPRPTILQGRSPEQRADNLRVCEWIIICLLVLFTVGTVGYLAGWV